MIQNQGLFMQSQEGFGGISSFTNLYKSESLDLNKMWKKAKENEDRLDKNYRPLH